MVTMWWQLCSHFLCKWMSKDVSGVCTVAAGTIGAIKFVSKLS
jgi:hypothetical protein